MELTALQTFWVLVLCLALLIYLVLDGFDLGVGILFGTTRDEQYRQTMMRTVMPVWDGNETWLIVVGAGLYAAFPAVYAVFFSALYLPIVVLLIALIFRGVAFEYRYRATRHRWLWDGGFVFGSLTVAFVQGAAIGALMQDLPVRDGQFVGGPFTWLSPFSVAAGAALVLGYMLHGAAWLALKTSGGLREWAYRRLPWLLLAVVLVLPGIITYAYFSGLDITRRWQDISGLWLFPAIALLALGGMGLAIRKRKDHLIFLMSALLFIASFGALASSFAPYMIPFSITVAQGAAAEKSLSFLFWGAGIVVLPVILLYTIIVYWIFRGRV